MLTVDISLPDIEELKALVQEGHEKGYLTFDEVAAALEEIELTKEQLEDFYTYLLEHNIELLDGGVRQQAQQDAADPRREAARARPHRRAQPRLAAAVPARDRQGAAAHGRPGGQPGQAHRARRHARQAADDRGQPAPGRLDREGLPGPRPVVPRPDPGGQPRPDPRGREVRLPQGLQVLDVRDVVDPPGRDPRDRRQGPHDPDPGAHGREAEPRRAHRAPAGAAAGPRAPARGDRPRAAT